MPVRVSQAPGSSSLTTSFTHQQPRMSPASSRGGDESSSGKAYTLLHDLFAVNDKMNKLTPTFSRFTAEETLAERPPRLKSHHVNSTL